MRVSTKKWLWLAVAVALVGGSFAVAQESTDDEEDTTEDASTGVRRRSDLTPEEQLAEAERIQHSAEGLSQRVMGMLDEARREGDIVRVTCLDDKLTQINAHVRTMGDRVESLQEATTTADPDRRNHEFTVITVLGQNFTQLERDANECIGQSLFETGTTRVVTEIDPSTPDEDPSAVPVIPVYTTPYVPTPATTP